MSEQDKRALLASGELLSIAEASAFTPYSAEYLSLLARQEKLAAKKIARNWLTTRAAVVAFVDQQKQRHKQMLRRLSVSGKERS